MTLVIIGGGPAGYVAAITAARFGREVVLIDQGQAGGTCLNEGCIPTKALLQSADMYEHVKSVDILELSFQNMSLSSNGMLSKNGSSLSSSSSLMVFAT